jgi:hypothetical protein
MPDVIIALNYMKNNAYIPCMYYPPEFFIQSERRVEPFKKRGRFFIPKSKKSKVPFCRSERNTAWENAFCNWWKPGANVYAGEEFLQGHKERSVISDRELYKFRKSSVPWAPDYLYMFVCSKDIYFSIYYSKYKTLPYEWRKESNTQNILEGVLRPLEKAFPRDVKLTRQVLRLADKTNQRPLCYEFFKLLNIRNRDEYLFYLSHLRELLFLNSLTISGSKENLTDDDLREDINFYEAHSDFKDMIVGDYELEDQLLDFEMYYHEPQFEDSDLSSSPEYGGLDDEFVEVEDFSRYEFMSARYGQDD